MARAGAVEPRFRPVLLDLVLNRRGYHGRDLVRDIGAGLTVAVVALPLSMAIAIASGLRPDHGLIAAIIGGFLISALGGSSHQIGGPAGAFIVLVFACVARHGTGGLLTATLLSGLALILLGVLRLGRFIRYVPYPVTVGFTAGIGVIILLSQVTPFLGLQLDQPEPGPVLEKVPVLYAALSSVTPAALMIGLGTSLGIILLRHVAPRLPGMLIAVALAAICAKLFALDVATIGSSFGALIAGLPAPTLPDLSVSGMLAVLPEAAAFTLLGAIESLLSAVVADSMSGKRHRPDTELIAQGIANIAAAFFAGMPVTGTIARTATNVRAGAVGPVSGMVHALALLIFLMIAAPLAEAIPLAALAGVLVTVSLHMIDVKTLATFLRAAPAEALVLLVTLGFTVFTDLTEGIVAGVALSGLVLAHRLAQTASVDQHQVAGDLETETDPPPDHGVLRLHLSGAFFFGTAPLIETVLERIGDDAREIVFDLSDVALIDSSAARILVQVARNAAGLGRPIRLAGASPVVFSALVQAGWRDFA